MLQRYQISDRAHLCKRIRLFQDAALQFAIFVSRQSNHICLIPAFGPAFTEMLQWPEAQCVGTYDENAQQMDIINDVREDACWIQNERRNKVHYHRYRNGVVIARSCLRRRTT
jgi:hypothetical protein